MEFSKSAKRGVFVFLSVCIVIFILPDLIVFFSPKPAIHIEQWSESERKAVEKVDRNLAFSYRKSKQKTYNTPPEKFDPNQYKFEDWMNLGLTEKQSVAVLKFLRYPIHSNAELKRIFIIPEELYEKIKDSTIYPKRLAESNTYAEYKLQQKLVLIDINSASIDQVLEADAIAFFDAKNILKFRDALGGFYSSDQFVEVWNQTPEKLEVWKRHLIVNPNAIQKLNINTASTKELSFHPYISWNLANSIVKLREQNGKFTQVEGIKKSVLMTTELFTKVSPYLTIEE
jgi:DNA uptake protein ComE-like DNA-binding protein